MNTYKNTVASKQRITESEMFMLNQMTCTKPVSSRNLENADQPFRPATAFQIPQSTRSSPKKTPSNVKRKPVADGFVSPPTDTQGDLITFKPGFLDGMSEEMELRTYNQSSSHSRAQPTSHLPTQTGTLG